MVKLKIMIIQWVINILLAKNVSVEKIQGKNTSRI